MLSTVLLVFSFVLACLAAANWQPPAPWPNLGWAAFAFFIAYLLFSAVGLR